MDDAKPKAEGDERLSIDYSGSCDLVGYRSSLPDEGGGACELNIGPQHLNRLGLLHGGFVSMLLDNGCGTAVRRDAGDIETGVVTVNMSVNYVAGVSSGRVIATGRVVGGGKTLKFAESELRDEAGRLLATCSATFKILRRS
ncbi:PaaI family thioesterase [Paracoccus sp. SCSIO 75233]|uniref:PaaI family thioesterase n=1 Tax=Paracoccus sp. SCSIO 75233 TaxID=3017782 RepID=UPI0022F0FD66|nr:PaaI family thioesterase [Paracoccus sp. SCSIO 75233]WBU53614.1 PaaI family thioesterase [Paracoccus sp. SCSIO 75233]